MPRLALAPLVLFAAASIAIADARAARADTVSYTVEIAWTSGPLAGTSNAGIVTYDDSIWTGSGYDGLSPLNADLTFAITIDAESFTEMDDIDFPGYPAFKFQDGVLLGLDFYSTHDVLVVLNQGAWFRGSYGAVTYAIYAVPTIVDVIAHIEALVDDGTLKRGQANGLIRPLENALKSLETDNLAGACSQLDDFIEEAQSKADDGAYGQEDADVVIDMVQAIQADIGC